MADATPTPPLPSKATIIKYAPPVAGAVFTALTLSGAAAPAIAGGASILSAVFGAAASGVAAFAGTIFKAGAVLAATVGTLPALGIAAALVGGLFLLVPGANPLEKLKNTPMAILNQLHPFEIPSLGLNGRLGSNLWQMPLLYLAASGVVGGIPGVKEAALGFWNLITQGAPVLVGAAKAQMTAASAAATTALENAPAALAG